MLKKGMCFILVSLAKVSLAAPLGPIESKLEQPLSQHTRFFADLSFHHLTKTYYDKDGYLEKQDPAFDTLFRLGFRGYRNKLEVFGQAGFQKVADTQKVEQKRGVIGIHYYPAYGPWGEVLLYNLNELPNASSEAAPSRQGTISTIGIAPQSHVSTHIGGWPIGLRYGVDIWSKVYSRKQMVDPENQVSSNNLSLAEKFTKEPQEEGSPSLWHEAKLGVFLFTGKRSSFITELMGFINQKNHPFYRYKESAEGALDKQYKATKNSRVRLRATLKLTSQLYIRNDFVKYYTGIFAPSPSQGNETLRNTFQVGFRF